MRRNKMIKQIIRASLLSMMFLCHSAFAMDSNQIIVQKSALLNALDNKTPLELNGKQYKVEGNVTGTFGENFRNSNDETIMLSHFRAHNKDKWHFLEDAGPQLDEQGEEIAPAIDGIASFTLEEVQ